MNLYELLSKIDDPRTPIILKIYKDHEDLFHTNPGSTAIHQAWEGGLADHLADMLRLSQLEYQMLSEFLNGRGERLPFTLGSAQVAIFCHDAEKMIVYGKADDPRCAKFIGTASSDNLFFSGQKEFKEKLKWDILDDWTNTYGLMITDAELNAVKYTHGEGEDYRNDRRVMNELAAFVGNIDRIGARILYNSGKDLG